MKFWVNTMINLGLRPQCSTRNTGPIPQVSFGYTLIGFCQLLPNKGKPQLHVIKLSSQKARINPHRGEQLKNQIFQGSDKFADDMQRKISPDTTLSEIPSSLQSAWVIIKRNTQIETQR